MEELNPYAAPKALAEPPPVPGAAADNSRCWRDGNELVAKPEADLPRFCVKCGQPAAEYRERKFYWHSPWLYLLILVHIIIYAIVALIVRKRANHKVGLCEAHQKRRRAYMALAWLSLVPLLGGFATGRGGMMLLGLLVWLVMLFWGLLGMQILKPKRIDEGLAVYRGVAPAFLAQLPRYPYRRD